MRRSLIRILTSGLIAGLLVAGGASAANADSSFEIVGTSIGIYPRAEPSMDSAKIGRALVDGENITVACETDGATVDNGYAPSSYWMQLSDGTYLPNAFILTGYDGRTQGLPDCDAPPAETEEAAEGPKDYSGIFVSNDRVSQQLINHYYDATGEPVVLDWGFIESSDRLLSAMEQLEPNLGYRTYESDPASDGEIYAALGAFTIARTSDHCFAIKDRYDFAPDKLANVPYLLNWVDAQFGVAAEFDVHASGCIY